jgi:hypothetical protein
MDPDRQYAVASLLFDYVKSPSLHHLRDPHQHRQARTRHCKRSRQSEFHLEEVGAGSGRGRKGCGPLLDTCRGPSNLSEDPSRSLIDENRCRAAPPRDLGGALHNVSKG